MAVCGSVEDRHGIVLAANQQAKKFLIRTGDAVWQAKQKCHNLLVVDPHYDQYMRFSKAAQDIYYEYSPNVEPFGLDECWIDLTGTDHLFGDGKRVADEIRDRIKFELGITASIGVSYNKVFAKLASDMKKPDATTVIGKENYQQKAWALPVSDLLYVGPATTKKLNWVGISTIGQLAKADPEFLHRRLGKWGVTLWTFANGLDNSPVAPKGASPYIKSIGNSTTTPKDLETDDDIRITVFLLSESVAARLREENFKCKTVQIDIRYQDMSSFQRQESLPFPCCTAQRIGEVAFKLIQHHATAQAIRKIGVRAVNLIHDEYPQLSLLPELQKEQRQESLEMALDHVRNRFGYFSVRRGLMLTDKRLSGIDAKSDHIIHPVSFFR